MVAPATLVPARTDTGRQQSEAPSMLVPFVRSSQEHIEPMSDTSTLLTANSVQLGPFDVPAYGYLRSLVLLVQATGGAGAAAVAQEDAPWTAIQEVSLIDVNGAPIVGPFSGYDLYLINKYGGYKVANDPKQYPSFGAVAATGNFSFKLRIPVEVLNRDALGSLANQNASSTYKLRVTLATLTGIYSVNPTTIPTVRIRSYLEAWAQPAAADLRGHPQATVPPAHGTTSYWSKTTQAIAVGSQTIRFPRVGNYIRNLLFVYRNAAGARVAGVANFPDPAQIFWDTRLLHNFTRLIWQDINAERYQLLGAIDAAGGLDSNVFPYDFAHEFDGRVGNELRDGWLPTVQSTRLELFGTFGEAGSFTILTNDVSPAGEVFV